jgi:hypothetical protein
MMNRLLSPQQLQFCYLINKLVESGVRKREIAETIHINTSSIEKYMQYKSAPHDLMIPDAMKSLMVKFNIKLGTD